MVKLLLICLYFLITKQVHVFYSTYLYEEAKTSILVTRLNKYNYHTSYNYKSQHTFIAMPVVLQNIGLCSVSIDTVPVRFLQFLSKPPLPVFFRGPTTARS